MAEQKKIKATRKRVNPTFRWSERTTRDLIMKVLECVKDSAESFERPTSQRFYESLAKDYPHLKALPWMCMKSKMRHCRRLYIEVTKWKQQTGDDLMAKGDERKVIDYMERKCPHYNELHQIYGHQIRIKNEDLSWSDFDQSPIADPLPIFSPEDTSELSYDTDHSMSASCEDANQIPEESPEKSIDFGSIVNKSESYEKEHKSDETDNRTLTLLMAMQQEKLQLEREKFEWQKKKEQRELENHFKIKQMELEQNERLKRFEIELKYRKNNGKN